MESKFDPEWYLSNNIDVRISGLDPFEHYVKYGKSENRLPSMPKWFFDSLSSDGWVNKEFNSKLVDLTGPKKISEVRVIRIPKFQRSMEIFKKLLAESTKGNRKYNYIILFRKENKFKFIDKNFIKIITLDRVNFDVLTTQIVGSMGTVFIINKNKIKVIKVENYL
jgi:hypothetical protein